jgi:hypothetical protein
MRLPVPRSGTRSSLPRPLSGAGHPGSDVPDGRCCGFDDSCCGAQNERGAGEPAKRSVLICGRNGAEEALEAGSQPFMRDPEFPEELFETRQVRPRRPRPESVRNDHDRVFRGRNGGTTAGPLCLQCLDGLSHEITTVHDPRRGGDRLRSHLIAVRVDSPELRPPTASKPPELTGDNLPSECRERVPLECRDHPPTVRLDRRKEEDEELVEPAAERVPTGWAVGEPEHEDPDPDEEQPPERAALEGETDYEDLPRSTTAVRGQRTSSSWNEPATRVPLACRDPAVTA